MSLLSLSQLFPFSLYPNFPNSSKFSLSPSIPNSKRTAYFSMMCKMLLKLIFSEKTYGGQSFDVFLSSKTNKFLFSILGKNGCIWNYIFSFFILMCIIYWCMSTLGGVWTTAHRDVKQLIFRPSKKCGI